MKRLVLGNVIFMLLVVTSCKTTDNNSSPESFGKDNKKNDIQPVRVINDFSAENAAKGFEIQKAVINNNLLNMTLSYTGCKDDAVDLVFNGNYLKSYPMKAFLYVRITPGKQGCDKKMVKDLQFDLTSIKPGSGKTLIVLLQDYKENLTYQY